MLHYPELLLILNLGEVFKKDMLIHEHSNIIQKNKYINIVKFTEIFFCAQKRGE